MSNIAATIASQLSVGYHCCIVPPAVPCTSAVSHLVQTNVDEVCACIRKLRNKSSPVDYIPTSLLKRLSHILAPYIVNLVNMSFASGQFPSQLKLAHVTPVLKKAGLDDSEPCNYRPISNLSTISKIMEKIYLARLKNVIFASPNFPRHQSGFRPGHSTETALLKVFDDLVGNAEKQYATLLLSLDISSAFDTIDHTILCSRIREDFGVDGTALKWLHSYLVERQMYVALAKAKSDPVCCKFGVPQGSVLGPILFSLYISPIGRLVESYGCSYHQYADDTQLYLAVRPGQGYSSLQTCTAAVRSWFLMNNMLLNPSKTEAAVFGTQARRSALLPIVSSVDVAGTSIQLSNSLKLLGVTFDGRLSFDDQITSVVKACNYHLAALRHIRPVLSKDVASMIACSIVGTRLDYCNGLYYGMSASNFTRLQRVQDSLAKTVVAAPQFVSASAARRSLHWLSIRQRVRYKLAVVSFKAYHTGAPNYLSVLLQDYCPTRRLRSSSSLLLSVPRVSLQMTTRGFAHAAPSTWNFLDLSVRSIPTLPAFKRHLKTYLMSADHSST